MIRSVTFTALFFLSIIPWSLVVVAARLAGPAASYAVARHWARTVMGLCRVLCGLTFRVEGLEQLPKAPSVALLKHSSAYETVVQLLFLPPQAWVLKRELAWAPFFGWALAALRPIAIDRGSGRQAVEQVVQQGTERLKAGLWVCVFPEGTRMPPGETRRYGVSGSLLAQRAGCLIVPIAHNAGDFWPRRGWRKRAGVVTFRIGAPVDPAGRDLRELNESIQRWIEGEVEALRRQPDPPAGSRSPSSAG
ncbi:MAG: 1-acyl-sn-glycerol-3-phosphate acyltransferase [Chromatiales bacterium]|nr:1-acyl-sn-glycerol-3-phosphate acyltransferase [Chromatiales bacterium]